MSDGLNVSERWRLWRHRVDLAEYDSRWDRLAAQGQRVHDEAELVCSLGGDRIVDAGCGTGRVAAELARRGKTVIGVDNDADMLALAEAKDADVRWVLADLATADLGRDFDVVVMAGDVLHYVTPGYEATVVANLSRQLAAGGRLVSGSTLAESDQLLHYDTWCRSAGLELEQRFATWAGAPYDRPGHYAVSIHRRPAGP
jgi:SAM-dependent methyltransferase